MNRASVLAFAARSTAERRKVFGQLVTYQGLEYCLALSAITSRRQIEAGGFDVLPDFVARVDVARYPDFAPVLGSALLVDGVPYLIAEIAKAGLAGEIRLALAKA